MGADNPPQLVAAGAGSGKTYAIVESVVAWVRAGTPVDRIAAVTFTDAAAAELQDRVRTRLLALGLHQEAARVDAADICTIHTFSLKLLQRYPLAAGLPPQPLVLDEDGASALVRRALSEVLRDDEDTPDLGDLLENSLGRGVGLSEQGFHGGDSPSGRLQWLVKQVLEKCRSVAMDWDGVQAEGARAAERLRVAMGPEGAAAALDAAMEEGLRAGWDYLDTHPVTTVKKDMPFLSALRELRPPGATGPGPAVAPMGSVALVDAALRLQRLDYGKALEKALGGLMDAVAACVQRHPVLRARLADGVRGVFSVAAGVMKRYTEEKSRLGAVDFEDMQLLALRLLEGRGPTGAAYAPLVARALPYVVVDEFQDTSPLQFRLFEALRAAGCAVKYVGDLKQGIYGFRTADAALFAALLDRAHARGEPVETLDRSRRSRPELVAFSNALFGALMPPAGLAFTPLVADNDYAAGRCPKVEPSIEVLRHPPRGNKHGPGVARVMALVAGGIPVLDRVQRVPRPVRYGDIAVLGRDRATLAAWARAFRARGVATVHEGEALFETLEVQLAHAWLRMLASPRDRAAAAAVLLSELYGVSQRTLVRLTLARVAGSPERALEQHRDNPTALPLTVFELRALMRCADDLVAGRAALRQVPLPEAVERVLESVGLAERLSQRVDADGAAQVRANLASLAALAHKLAVKADAALRLAGASGATVENLLLELDRAREAGMGEPQGGDEALDAVKLVTVHKSKGMEYPVVVLDLLDRKLEVRLPRVEVVRAGEGDALLADNALRASAVQVVPDVGVAALADTLRDTFGGVRNLRQEWLRLLYVGVTRARDHLVWMWPEDAKSGTTAYVKGLITAGVPSLHAQGVAPWLGVPVHVVPAAAEDTESATEDDDVPDLAPWRALADDPTPESPWSPVPGGQGPPRLARVSPTELCEVADCPEVPRLRRFQREEHRLVRTAGPAVQVRALPDARTYRLAVPEAVAASTVGTVVHAAVQRASLRGDAGSDETLARAVVDVQGITEAVEAWVGLIVRTLASVRAAVDLLGATVEPAREVPFVLDCNGTMIHGAMDLVVRAPDGLHVLDLKTHPLMRPDLPRWAAYYQPQLLAYGLALHRITRERVAGLHLVVPAAGALVTLPDGLVVAQAEAVLGGLCDQLVTGARGGPAQPCATCGWRSDCRTGKALLRERTQTEGGAA